MTFYMSTFSTSDTLLVLYAMIALWLLCQGISNDTWHQILIAAEFNLYSFLPFFSTVEATIS